jgi:hypothetical protein
LIYAIPVFPIVDKALGLDFLIAADFRQRPVFESFYGTVDEKKAGATIRNGLISYN